MSANAYFLPLREAIPFVTSENFPSFGDEDLLDRVGIANFEVDDAVAKTSIALTLAFRDELVVGILGLDNFGLVFGSNGAGSESPFEVQVRPEVEFRLSDIDVALRLRQGFLTPVERSEGKWRPVIMTDGHTAPFEIRMKGVTLVINADGDISLSFMSGTPALTLGAFMIGETGVVVEVDQSIELYLSSAGISPAGRPVGWKGVRIPHALLHLPEINFPAAPAGLEFVDCFIGSDGFSGQVAAVDFATGAAAGNLGGISFELRRVALNVQQNTFAAYELRGTLTLPFFDAPLNVEIGISLDGSFTVAIAAVQPPGTDYTNGLVIIEKANILRLTLESLQFSTADSVFTVALSGEITPLIGGLDWPSFRVQELSIDSEGYVRLEGGWLDLREQYALSLYGFQLEIAKIGFGTADDGRRWIGFSGGLKLVDGLSAGASVEGLRILWDPSTNQTALTLNGIGVEFEVPEVIYFKGAVAMSELPGGGVRFDGAITLSLVALQLEVEAQLVIGYDKQNDYTFFAIYLGVELPAGIPLWTTGLGLYGAAGLFALQMEPDKGKRKPDGTLEFPDEAWYAIQPANSWYHRDTAGVTDLGKWRNQEGSLALGAGVTIGTVADNGFTFAGRFLLGIVFPGPILFIEGRANLLKERASLRGEPLFRALAVLDARAGSFLVGLDAQYKVDDSGALIEIGGGAEAFFDFYNPKAWHLYLGIDEPRERRIRAEIIQRIFEANAYFMLDSQRLKTGAWIGYEKDWKFGPLSILLQAWIEGGATLSWKPVYLSGYLWLHGRIDAKVFGFGFGLGADARFDAGVFDPFHVRAELSVNVDLPWPLPDAEADIVLEWGPEPNPPLLPVPLKEVSIDHLKVTTSWPLPATGQNALLSPNPDDDGDGFFNGTEPPVPSNTERPPANAPVVPLDARPRLTFGRPVNDDARAGVNPSTGVSNGANDSGWERIGDPDTNQGPAEVKSALQEIALQHWTGTEWQTVARTEGQGTNDNGVADLWGSWAPVPQLPEGTPGPPDYLEPTANTKLWLWSRSPFDFTRRTSGMWEEWFYDTYPNYPCVSLPPDREACCGFEPLPVGPAPEAPWICPQHPELVIGWRIPPRPRVVATSKGKALCFAQGSEAAIHFASKIKMARIFVSVGKDKEASECLDFTQFKKGRWKNPRKLDGLTFSVFNRQGQAVPAIVVKTWNVSTGPLGGIDAGCRTVIELAESVDAVEIILTRFAAPARLIAFDDANRPVASLTMTGQQRTPETVRLEATIEGLLIKTIQIDAPQNELAIHRVCRLTRLRSIIAIARDHRGNEVGRFIPKGNVIEIPGREVTDISLIAEGKPFCLDRICWVVGLTAAERLSREEMARHIATETVRWHEEGFVLKPFTNYRLKVTTTVEVRGFQYDAAFNTTYPIVQCAYFRTEGPPGLVTLSIPEGHPVKDANAPTAPADPPVFDSGLNDLTRYVKQTIPPTVAPAGKPPILPRPVYRGYDVGVQFNEDYVEQMYRAAARDLGLYLYDANGTPARDPLGRPLALSNRWGTMPVLELSVSDERWLQRLDNATCQLIVVQDSIPRPVTLTTEGHLLAPSTLYEGRLVPLRPPVHDPDCRICSSTLYEGRLVPLLVHDGFDAYLIGATAVGADAILTDGVNCWSVQDFGAYSAPSRWVVRESGSPAARFLEQTSDVSQGAAARGDAFPGGTFLVRAAHPALAAAHPDRPENWTDYRASVFVRSADDGLIGLSVRITDEGRYLVYLDQQLNRRRLVRLQNGIGTLLAESQGSYLSNQDYHLSVEVSGDRLRVNLDGEILFDVTDAKFQEGGIALFAGANAGAAFTDLRVDDLRASPVVHRFKFATSRFADFRHHILSYRDETWRARLPDISTLRAAAAAAIDPQAVALTDATATEADRWRPPEAEARAFASLAVAALGTVALQPVTEVEVTRVAAADQERALLVRTGEPIDWGRTELIVLRSPEKVLRPTPPGDIRIARVGFSRNGVPNDEFVTLLLLNAANLAGHRIERRSIRSAASPDLPDGTILFEPDLTTNANESPLELTILWRPRLIDLSEVVVVPVHATTRPVWSAGSSAITQDAFVGLTLRSNRPPIPVRSTVIGGDAAWTDYRFSVSITAHRAGGIGLLIRYVDRDNYYRLELDRLRGQTVLVRRRAGADTVLGVRNGSYTVGQSYQLTVEADGSHIVATLDGVTIFDLFDDALQHGRVGFLTLGGPKATFQSPIVQSVRRSINEWTIEDFGSVAARSSWKISNRALVQEVDVGGGGNVNNTGTVVLAGEPAWTDIRISCRMAFPGSGVAGCVLRWRGPADHYRIVADSVAAEIRFVRVAGGLATVLHKSSIPAGTAGLLRIEAIETCFRFWWDGNLAGEIYDATHADGLAGLLSVRGRTEWHQLLFEHAEPNWQTWFTLSDQTLRQSGACITIFSGQEHELPPLPIADEEPLFAGATAATFHPRFPRRGVDLRIVDGSGVSGHTSRFVPDSTFGRVASARIVRAADGTGFAVLIPDGMGDSILPSGQYRLSFVFHRDNRTRDSESLVLSKSGNTSDEQVNIDVPWATKI